MLSPDQVSAPALGSTPPVASPAEFFQRHGQFLPAPPGDLARRLDVAPGATYNYQVSAVNGDGYHSITLDQRQRDLEIDAQLLRNRFTALMRERREYLDNYSEDFGKDVESQKARDASAKSRINQR